MEKDYIYPWWLDVGYSGEYVYGDDIYVDDWYTDERWLPIRDLEDRYWISTHGRIWSAIRKQFVYGHADRRGYIDVCLHYPDGYELRKYMHVLVAETFIPNPMGYPEVLHGPDDDPSNCCVWNLRWGTHADNMRDAIDRNRFRFLTDEDRERAMVKRRMPITAYNVRTGAAVDFESQQEAARVLNICQSDVWDVLNGQRKHAKGWVFTKYGEDPPYIDDIDLHRHVKRPFIRAIDVDTGEEFVFHGLTEAAKELGVSISSISLVLSGETKCPKRWFYEYIDEEYYDE